MPRQYPTESQRRTLWTALTGLALVIIGALAVGFVLLLGNVLAYLQPVLVPLAVAGILAFLLNPIVAKLEQKGASRLQGIIAVYAVAAVIAVAGAWFAIPRVARQAGDLIERKDQIGEDVYNRLVSVNWIESLLSHWNERHPKFEEAPQANESGLPDDPANSNESEDAPPPTPSAPPAPEPPPSSDEPPPEPDSEQSQDQEGESRAEDTGEDEDGAPGIPFRERRIGVLLEQNEATIKTTALEWFKVGGGKIFGFIGYALGFMLVPVYLYFFLLETATIKRRWGHFVPLKESRFKEEVIATLSEMNDYLIAFFRGQVLVSIIDGFLTGLALSLLGLPYAWVIGVILAVLGVMPFIGFLVTLIPALIIAAVEWQDWQHPLAVFAIFFIVQQIDGLFIQPKVIGDKVGLHPMTIIFSIFFWSLILGGFLGALLAIPLTASVKVLFTRYVWDPSILDKPPENDEPDPPPEEAAKSSG